MDELRQRQAEVARGAAAHAEAAAAVVREVARVAAQRGKVQAKLAHLASQP
jgi:hypothetical protein